MTLLVSDNPDISGAIDNFLECCDQQAWFYNEGWISLQTAADNLQSLAERWGLVDEIGQDAVQRLIAYECAPEPASEPEIPTDYAADIVRQWELADPRDAWRHTGEAPPPAIFRNSDMSGKSPDKLRPNCPASSTVAAFKYVLGLGDPVYLAKWLSNHSAEAPALLETLEKAA
jgi:hypothetical protein